MRQGWQAHDNMNYARDLTEKRENIKSNLIWQCGNAFENRTINVDDV